MQELKQNQEMQQPEVVMHGYLGVGKGWDPPRVHSEFNTLARTTFTDISASEFVDTEETLAAKVRCLAALIREAAQGSGTIAYTGAGISTAAGIDCFATHNRDTSAAGEATALKDWKSAKPTYSHYAMTTLYEHNLLQHWIQQNHDSLPQKAGYPQEALNEIHGSLHDPSNPIVPYEGTLRDDLYQWMKSWQEKSCLCIAMGTSLSGFNADSTPEVAASRGRLVLINLQHTPMDSISSLRIYARIDTVMKALMIALNLDRHVAAAPANFPALLPASVRIAPDLYRLPVDPVSCVPSPDCEINWDLRTGARILLLGGPYDGDVGTVVEKNNDGHYRIRFEDSVNETLRLKRAPFSLWLGSWWINCIANMNSICPDSKIPLVNISEEEFLARREAKRQQIATDTSIATYLKMLKVGVPRHVVVARMQRDGCTESLP